MRILRIEDINYKYKFSHLSYPYPYGLLQRIAGILKQRNFRKDCVVQPIFDHSVSKIQPNSIFPYDISLYLHNSDK